MNRVDRTKFAALIFATIFLTACSDKAEYADAGPAAKSSAPSLSSTTIQNWLGEWKSFGKPAWVKMEKNSLIVENENGFSTKAEFKDGRIFAVDWKTSGTLSADGKVISWDNNTSWTR